MEGPVAPITSSGRYWPVAVYAAHQIIYATLLNPTGSKGSHCRLSKFEWLWQISTRMYWRYRPKAACREPIPLCPHLAHFTPLLFAGYGPKPIPTVHGD